MAQSGYTPISLYYSTTTGTTPSASNLVNGELAINIADGKIYYKDNTGAVQSFVSASATGGIFVNNQTITSSYTFANGTSGTSAGPIRLASGVSVTVPSGSRWVIL